MSSLFGARRPVFDDEMSPGWPPLPVAPRRPARPAVFVDRDGALVQDPADSAAPARQRFVPGALQALSTLAAAGYALLLVTHRSGLALGSFARSRFAQRQAALRRQLHDEAGIVLQDDVVCPHAPGLAGRPACLCRKPAPGLLLRAARMHDLDLAASWMVGGMLDDVEAGRRAGCRSLLLDGGGETAWRLTPMRQPHRRCTGWGEVAAQIVPRGPGRAAGAEVPLS